MYGISRNAKTTKICDGSLRVAILIFIVKQAVPATFIDFLQALTLQIHLETVKMQQKCITIEICAKTHFHTSVAAILVRGHPYISLPIGNDNTSRGGKYSFCWHRRSRDTHQPFCKLCHSGESFMMSSPPFKSV